MGNPEESVVTRRLESELIAVVSGRGRGVVAGGNDDGAGLPVESASFVAPGITVGSGRPTARFVVRENNAVDGVCEGGEDRKEGATVGSVEFRGGSEDSEALLEIDAEVMEVEFEEEASSVAESASEMGDIEPEEGTLDGLTMVPSGDTVIEGD